MVAGLFQHIWLWRWRNILRTSPVHYSAGQFPLATAVSPCFQDFVLFTDRSLLPPLRVKYKALQQPDTGVKTGRSAHIMNTQDKNNTPDSLRRELETFNNPNPDSDYSIRIRIPEFTCLCPKTGQPDFATLYLDYIPEASCVELKSLKLYTWSYRDTGAFHEAVTHEILNDLVRAMAPRYARLTARFNVRGGIYTTIVAEHRASDWSPATPETIPPPISDND
jgi:7-cyano-7-deazaguanine reductase